MRAISKQQRAKLEPLLRRTGMPDVTEYLQALTELDAEWLLVELSYPQFRKVDGTWAILGPVECVRKGGVVVNKKDLTQTTVQVKRISKPFTYMGRKMAHGFMK